MDCKTEKQRDGWMVSITISGLFSSKSSEIKSLNNKLQLRL